MTPLQQAGQSSYASFATVYGGKALVLFYGKGLYIGCRFV